mgnify:CR=1 FL=1
MANGEHIDITDTGMPYLYSTIDPNTDLTPHIAVGSTPGNYGWVEWTGQDAAKPFAMRVAKNYSNLYWPYGGQFYVIIFLRLLNIILLLRQT